MTAPRPRCPGGPHSPHLRRPESMIDTMTAQLPATWRPGPLDPTGWLVLDRPVGVEGPWIDEIRTRLRVLDPPRGGPEVAEPPPLGGTPPDPVS